MSDADHLEAIKQLKARYFRLLDTQQWDALTAVFTPDVEVDTSAADGTTTRGVDDFLRNVRRALAGATTVHHGHMPEIELTSPRTARGIWAMEDQIWWPAGGPVRHLHGYGHYHETYVHTDADGWRIRTMTLTRLRRDVDT